MKKNNFRLPTSPELGLTLRSALLALLVIVFASIAFAGELTTDLIPIERLAKTYVEDVDRIEVFYPKQFERLEMDWRKASRDYVQQFEKEKNLEKKLHIFARLVNSWNNAHHAPISVKGYTHNWPTGALELPIRVFGEGVRLSQARFFVSELPEKDAPPSAHIGDEIVAYDGQPIKNYVTLARDQIPSESPEAHINSIAREFTLQKRCRWGKLRCWKAGDTVELTFKSRATGALSKTTMKWRALVKDAFAKPPATPQFGPEDSAWSYQPLSGTYGVDFDATPDGEYGFYGILKGAGHKFLVIKIFEFRDLAFVQSAIREARKRDYDGVILDFGDNAGGNNSAMTLLGGLLGVSFNLELSSLRLVKEFRDFDTLKEASFGEKKAAFFLPYAKDANFGKMAPFTPFACLDRSCPLKTEYRDHLESFPTPVYVGEYPVNQIALITGRGTASKSDSIAALFRATRIGPIVGTPAIGSSGTYYFRKEYVVKAGGKALTIGVTFTPDFSLGSDCEEIQANPPEPTALVERTFENRRFYDTRTWIVAAGALTGWSATARVDRSCDLETAKAKLKARGLGYVERAAE